MRVRRILIAVSSLAVVAAGLALTPSASADSVQWQSYQRASQTEACVAQVGETPWQASWGADSSWHPTWEQWANAGRGGWTCTRSITWAKASVYAVGEVGPGGGLVFLISGGLTYEMAPNTWSGAGTPDAATTYCDDPTNVPDTAGTAVGTGAANTAAMFNAGYGAGDCGSDAAVAVLAYAPAGTNAGQWFLPSQGELNAMCNYSRNPTIPPTGTCTGAQDGTFSTGEYGFAGENYWSSSEDGPLAAYYQTLTNGDQLGGNNSNGFRVRPVRAF